MAYQDPYRNFKFTVDIDGFTRFAFSKVSGLKHTVQTIDYREGGDNEVTRKLPGQSQFDNITFERGISTDEDFVTWLNLLYNVSAIDGAHPPEDTESPNFRKTVVVNLKNKSGEVVKVWTILRAWPTEVSWGDLDATSNEVLISSMVLANEGISLTVGGL